MLQVIIQKLVDKFKRKFQVALTRTVDTTEEKITTVNSHT